MTNLGGVGGDPCPTSRMDGKIPRTLEVRGISMLKTQTLRKLGFHKTNNQVDFTCITFSAQKTTFPANPRTLSYSSLSIISPQPG
jgi:hypothetical protein